ncbi:hypothetical protein NCC49_005538 [Naganishia albida]|nr:hypothetical protein NCC49_005538 [Naganishia albida]
MSIPDSVPLIVRKAKDDLQEFRVIGKLHAAAFAENPVYNLLFSKMGRSVALQWLWIDNAKQWAAKGVDTVLVLERTDTSEIVGLARYNKYDEAFKPRLWDDTGVTYPEGFNREESMRLAVPLVKWHQELMGEHGRVLSLQDFVIAPAHQKRGYGKWFLSHIIELAKEERMNIALFAGSDQSGFWNKLGFREVGDPITCGKDGSTEENSLRQFAQVCKMLLQFDPKFKEAM